MAVCIIMEEEYANGMGFSHFYIRLYEHCGRQEGFALLSLRNNMWVKYATYTILTSRDS